MECVDGCFEEIWGFPESRVEREPTRAALHVALLVLISGLDNPVALQWAPPSSLSHRPARIFRLATAMYIYIHTQTHTPPLPQAPSRARPCLHPVMLVLSAEGAQRIDRLLRLHETPRTTHSRQRGGCSFNLLPRADNDNRVEMLRLCATFRVLLR